MYNWYWDIFDKYKQSTQPRYRDRYWYLYRCIPDCYYLSFSFFSLPPPVAQLLIGRPVSREIGMCTCVGGISNTAAAAATVWARVFALKKKEDEVEVWECV